MWNKEVCGNVGTKKAEAFCRVGCWDNLEKERELSLEESEERVKARDDYKRWSLLKEVSWRQKSRELWLKEGIETSVSSTKWLTRIEGDMQ